MSELSQPPELSGIAQSLGIERGEWGSGKASLSVEVGKKHLNKGGVAHGGLYTMMLDMALGGALVSTLPVEEWCATTSLTTTFLAPAQEGDVLAARGELIRRGRNVAHLKGEVISDRGTVIASATGVWAIWQKRPEYMPGRQ